MADEPKILCVDDDEKILNGILRQQGDQLDISVALGPLVALEMLENEGPFAVVVSDMRMPDMNGVQLLKRVRDMSPNTVRMMLTGFADLQSTIEAVNEGHIFRFLAKPCTTEDLASSLTAGLKQFALVEAEKELVEGTLHGSVKVLSEVLSLVNPLAFGQTTRVCATVQGMLKRLELEDQWQLEIAAMLSSLGCVVVPADILKTKLSGQAISADEEAIFSRHPKLARDLLASIPRLGRVAEIVGFQNAPLDAKSVDGTPVPIESRILKLAIDFDLMEQTSESPLHAWSELKNKGAPYDKRLMDALGDYIRQERDVISKELPINQIEVGMVLAEDVRDAKGTLLMSKGQTITLSASRLLENFSKNKSVKSHIKVVLNKEAGVMAPAMSE